MATQEESIELLRVLGAPDLKSTNRTMLDSISRAVMRNPGADAQILIGDLKRGLAHFCNDLTDNQINHILSNTSESRGHFKDAKSVRDFLSGAIHSSLSADIAAIDGLLSAINYSRSFGEITGNDEIKEVKRKVNVLMENAPPYIGHTFTERNDDLAPRRTERGKRTLTTDALQKHTQLTDGEILAAPDETVSVASGFDARIGMIGTPKVMPQRQLFKKQGYAQEALEAGVPIVGHVSGTTPGNLTAANAILKAFQEAKEPRKEAKGLTSHNAEILAGLTAASFHRSKFHSPPEVLVGLRHYQGTLATRESVGHDLRELYAESILMMGKAGAQQISEAIKSVLPLLKETPNLSESGEKDQPSSVLTQGVGELGDIGERPGVEIQEDLAADIVDALSNYDENLDIEDNENESKEGIRPYVPHLRVEGSDVEEEVEVEQPISDTKRKSIRDWCEEVKTLRESVKSKSPEPDASDVQKSLGPK